MSVCRHSFARVDKINIDLLVLSLKAITIVFF